MYNTGIRLASILGTLAVISGAFGAHMLKNELTSVQLDSWKTAVLYMFLHTVTILALSLTFSNHNRASIARLSIWLFAIGIVLFSGSIMILVCQDLLGITAGWLGPVTPIGGVLFVAGWLNLARIYKST